jgi:hypothetical protein
MSAQFYNIITFTFLLPDNLSLHYTETKHSHKIYLRYHEIVEPVEIIPVIR